MANQGDCGREVLERTGAVLRGHFLLTSGKHSAVYIEKFELIQRPDVAVKLCERIAERFASRGIETIAGPTTAGSILSFEIARQMGLRSIIAERSADDRREFRRGFKIGSGERFLVVDDVLTTGGSVRQTVEAVRARGGDVVGAGVLIDRTGGMADVGTELWAVMSVSEPAYDPNECPLCRQGVPLEKRGSSNK